MLKTSNLSPSTTYVRHGGIQLTPQHLGGGDRRMRNLRPAWGKKGPCLKKKNPKTNKQTLTGVTLQGWAWWCLPVIWMSWDRKKIVSSRAAKLHRETLSPNAKLKLKEQQRYFCCYCFQLPSQEPRPRALSPAHREGWWMDGWVDGRMVRRMDRWTGRWTEWLILARTCWAGVSTRPLFFVVVVVVEKGFPYIVQTALNLASFCPISHTLGSQVCTTVAKADVITTHSEINHNH